MVTAEHEKAWRDQAAQQTFEALNEEFEEIFAERTDGEHGPTVMRKFLAMRHTWFYMVTNQVMVLAEEEAKKIGTREGWYP
jgi:hypothetical protein